MVLYNLEFRYSLRQNLMVPEKENILKMIQNLPDDISMEDIIEAIYVRKKIEKGLKDSKEEKLYIPKEAKERLAKWLK